jgi:uncharacterized protein YjbI with pentapeptide repeats
MADPKHLKILNQGAEAWNNWRESEFYTAPELRGTDFREIDIGQMDLSGVDLSNSNFSGKDLSDRGLMDANLTGTELNGANLTKARLVSANLFLADLIEADLSLADLQAADFRYANLSKAKLPQTYLGGANFTGADLYEASFDGALFNGTIFGDNDLSVVTGLELVNHNGPSVIGIDTLYRSKGRIPELFLRGCGVSDEFIVGLPSLIAAQRSEMFDSCFISYSHKDEEFGKRLVSRMRDSNVRVWFSSEDVTGGKKTIEQIKWAIETHDRLLVVLSLDSLQSEWVKTEIRIATTLEKRQGGKKLFPIRLIDMEPIKEWSCFDADTGKDLAAEVREYPIPDFAAWKEDSNLFETEFERLIRALRKESNRERTQ